MRDVGAPPPAGSRNSPCLSPEPTIRSPSFVHIAPAKMTTSMSGVAAPPSHGDLEEPGAIVKSHPLPVGREERIPRSDGADKLRRVRLIEPSRKELERRPCDTGGLHQSRPVR